VFRGFILTTLVIALIPVLLFVEGGVAQGLLTALSAGAIAATAFNMRADDVDHLDPLLPRVAIAALVPATWMLLQTIPAGGIGLGHPIWASAGVALGRTLSASISLDPGATLIAFGRYAGFVAFGLAVSIVAADRQRAEWTLFAVLAATTTVAFAMLSGLNPDTDPRFSNSGGPLYSAPTIAAIGCIIAVAAALRAYERSETRRQGPDGSILVSATHIAIASIAFGLCLVALLRFGHGYAFAASGLGFGIFAALALTRRLGFGMWGFIAISIALVVVAAAVFSGTNIVHPENGVMALAGLENQIVTGITARILSDARWLGTGAGTFSEIAQLYRDYDAVILGPIINGPTTSAVIAVELGRPALVFTVAAAIALLALLIRASIERGRDSFYPAAGAASLCILIITSFGESGLLDSSLAITASAIVGLAVAQSASRKTH
jgi:hypothetical protein